MQGRIGQARSALSDLAGGLGLAGDHRSTPGPAPEFHHRTPSVGHASERPT